MFGVKLGLGRMETFLRTLSEPHLAYPVVHIGGTNGKGSVAAMVTAALVEGGYRVGTMLSPHVEALNERIQIDGTPIDDSSLEQLIGEIDRARTDWVQATSGTESLLTYFEFVTAAGFLHFARRQVNVAVVEVGLGGRLDATNGGQPLVCAISSIGLDHTEQLGDDLADIAREKAGIFKPRVPVVIGPTSPKVQAVLVRQARMRHAPLWKPGKELRREQRRDKWSFSTPVGTVSEVKLGLRGDHQAANATVALGVLHMLRKQGFLLTDDNIRLGFAKAFLPGRLEVPLPALVLDGAHNIDGTTALANWLQKYRPKPKLRILLWGMGRQRDPMKTILPLLPLVDEVVTTRCGHPKAWDPVELALHMSELETAISAGGTIEETLPEVYREADETIVAGSLFLAGAARALVDVGALDGIEPGQGVTEPLEELEMVED
jgi:dihydrofolate synthase / folylpolyglutamate synthase